jgi:hypothetical protein
VAAHVYPTFLTQAGLQLTFYRSGVDDTTRLLMPCVLGNMLAAPYHIWGEFEGLYWTPGYSVASESLIQESRFDHLVVQNVFRVAAQNYGAVRLD